MGLLAGLVAGCARTPPVRSVDLRILARRQDHFAGDRVRTSGRVVRFTDATRVYYVLEDARQDRVELLPASRASGFDERTVTVTGRFYVSGSIGRFIRVEQIRPSAGGSSA